MVTLSFAIALLSIVSALGFVELGSSNAAKVQSSEPVLQHYSPNIFSFVSGPTLNSSHAAPGGTLTGTLILNDTHSAYPMRMFYDDGSGRTDGNGPTSVPGLLVNARVASSGSFVVNSQYFGNMSGPYYGPFSKTNPLFTPNYGLTIITFQITVPGDSSVRTAGAYEFWLDFVAYSNSSALFVEGAKSVMVTFNVV